ncbi:transglycosylase domain-containing protein [Peptoniphilus sp.]|jgi:penicillin-binding protein 1A|uniref:transglycosylase domain-containing protein n=1 Tax=Peptoniphilus sp. TaxID=1971214 RepID=UPI003D8B905D
MSKLTKFKDLNKKDRVKIILLAVLVVLILIFSILSAIIISIISKTPSTNLENLTNSFNQTSYIYSKDNTLIEKVESLEYRTLVDLDDIPDHVKNSFVAIEDHRFYTHKGLDPIGIASSLVANIKSGALVRGGSTITQQLVRSVYLSNAKTMDRKIQEAYLSLRVEDVMSKGEILEAYLNRINLGQGAYGIEAASQTYFSKHTDELNIAEAALLAGIPKSPTNYAPFKSVPEDFLTEDLNVIGTRTVDGQKYYLVLNQDAFDRQKIVLHRMKELGYIDDAEYEKAMNFDIISDLNPKVFKNHNMSSYSTDFIKSEASKYLADYYKISLNEGEHKLFTGGYKVYSSIDENMQNNLEEKYSNFQNFLLNYKSTQGSRLLNLSFDDNKNIVYNDEILYFQRDSHFDENFNLTIPKDAYNISSHGDLKINRLYFKKVGNKLDIIDLYRINDNKILETFDIGELQIDPSSYDLKNDYLIIDGSYIKELDNFYKIDENENLVISNNFYNFNPEPVIQPESAMIVSNNDTGFVEAIIGGLDVNSKNAKILNRATDSLRQPGSIITPFTVYLPALMEGKTLGDVYDDVPLTVDGMFWPHNYYNSFKGLMTLRGAMEKTSNVINAEVLQEIGIDKSKEVLKSFDIIKEDGKDFYITKSENPKKHDDNLESLALGNMQVGVTLFDISKMYQTIANEGLYKEQTAIIKIEDSSGNIIIDNTDKSKKLFDDKKSFLLKDVFIRNTKYGNARGSQLSNAQTAAYVGQNRFNSDYWISGFSDKYTVSMWLGADTQKISLSSDTSSVVNLFNMMTRDIEDNSNFPEDPHYIVKRYISTKSGKLGNKLTEYANSGYTEKYITGTETTEEDDMFKKYLICKDSDKIATQFCPSESVLYTVRFQRKEKYNPKDHYNIYPDDYMVIPSSYCDVHTREWVEENGEDNNSNDD